MKYRQVEIDGLSRFSIDTDGVIRNIKTGKIVSTSLNKKGYVKASLDGRNYRVHRLVAKAFIPNKSNLPEIDHINEIKNDNRVENLRWCTANDNTEYYMKKYNRRKIFDRAKRINTKEKDKLNGELHELDKVIKNKNKELLELDKMIKAKKMMIGGLKLFDDYYKNISQKISDKLNHAISVIQRQEEKFAEDVRYEKIRLHNISLSEPKTREDFSKFTTLDKWFKEKKSKSIIVDKVEFHSIHAAAKYIKSKTNCGGSLNTISKELGKYLSGKQKIHTIHGCTVGY